MQRIARIAAPEAHQVDKPVDERRQWKRTRLSTVAVLDQKGQRITGQVRDLSPGGALVYLDEEVHCGQGPYSMSISFSRDPEEAILVLVRIVQVAHRFMRIQWQQPLPPEDCVKLRLLLQRELGTLRVVHNPLPMLIWPTGPLKARRSDG